MRLTTAVWFSVKNCGILSHLVCLYFLPFQIEELRYGIRSVTFPQEAKPLDSDLLTMHGACT